MPNLSANVPPIDVQFVDLRTGLITQPWWFFLLQLFRRTGGNTGGNGLISLADVLALEPTNADAYAYQQSSLATDALNVAPPIQSQFSDFSTEMTFAPPSRIDGAALTGTTAADNGAPGTVGEFISNAASGVALTNSTAATVTSVSLTPGEWDVSGSITLTPTGGTSFGNIQTSVSLTNNTMDITLGHANYLIATFPANSPQAISTPVVRVGVAVTTIVYLITLAVFGAGTATAAGYIRARRAR